VWVGVCVCTAEVCEHNKNGKGDGGGKKGAGMKKKPYDHGGIIYAPERGGKKTHARVPVKYILVCIPSDIRHTSRIFGISAVYSHES